MTPTVNLGDKVQCMVTNLTGIVVSKAQSLYGCVRIGIQPPMGADGKVPDTYWCDEPAVVVQTPNAVNTDARPASQRTGGPALPGHTPTTSNPRL